MARMKRIKTPLGQRLHRARIGALPLLVWLGAAGLAAQLLSEQPEAGTHAGLVRGVEHRLGAPRAGVVAEVLVEPYGQVAEGEPVALMDSAPIEARLATARAELGRLGADMDGERAALEVEEARIGVEARGRVDLASSTASLEFPAEIRAFHSDEVDLELERLAARLAIATGELESERLEILADRFQLLADRQLGPEADALDAKKRLGLERVRTAGQRTRLGQVERELEVARSRRRAVLEGRVGFEAPALADPRFEERLSGWLAAIEVQSRRVAELELEAEGAVLRAPSGGVVVFLGVTPGQALVQGDPVMTVSSPTSTRVSFWIRESEAPAGVQAGRFWARAAFGASTTPRLECRLEAVSPRVGLIPDRLWKDPRVPEYGVACELSSADVLPWVPGVRLRIDPIE